MSKFLGGALLGVFFGAFVVEVINRKRPGAIKDVEDRAMDKVHGFKEAFKEGYQRKVQAGDSEELEEAAADFEEVVVDLEEAPAT